MPSRESREKETVQHWIEQLPPEVVRTRPSLCLASALRRSASSATVDRAAKPAIESAAPAVPTSKPVKANRPALQSPPQQDLLDPLSLRELEVLHLMVQGATNAEIALTLALAVETIKRHVSNILSKLGVANRTQAAVRAADEHEEEDDGSFHARHRRRLPLCEAVPSAPAHDAAPSATLKREDRLPAALALDAEA
ncbi:MAG TPA: helix-turn-helix transcriptional regulator [Ktedonobacteraceae bacterium]